jgi:hypothetical protein
MGHQNPGEKKRPGYSDKRKQEIERFYQARLIEGPD